MLFHPLINPTLRTSNLLLAKAQGIILGDACIYQSERGTDIRIQKAVALAADRALGYAMLGFRYFMSERYEETIQAFLAAIRLEPLAYTYSSLGKAYARLGRYRAALDSFAHAVLLSPDHPELQESVGEFHSATPRCFLIPFTNDRGLERWNRCKH